MNLCLHKQEQEEVVSNRNYDELKETARKIRVDVIRAIHEAGSGHPGGSLSATDILTALYFDTMNINPENPKMEGRDKFVLSKGHAVPALYATLAERGFYDVEEMMTLRKIGSHFQGHPNMHKVPGLEMSTGSLGQGFSVAVGMATAGKMDGNPGRVYALCGDGELQEGIIWEAALSAAHRNLDNLVLIVDWNGLQIDGKVDDVKKVTPLSGKFQTFGWHVINVDGHSFPEILAALDEAKTVKGQPTAIIAKTHKGHGVSFMEDQAGWHGKAPNDEQFRQAMEELGGVQ
ncbi:MAG: transketolase [Clostridia bacterium]|uniref:Transketolase n=1 Tax=Mogibacterium kristiansenii TaxID=2606708 RepID=A0A6N7XJ59_9FIRM|nr:MULTISPECIES: transketolase [Mogibacterium]MDY5450341.1 transketolase [Clostridia bacterium]MEE0368965.1 transketolase [Clostridia bacterium]MEE0553154.1 transketolase [Clostridia bacterium]MST71258.1 transketolase [Mogibacterium kristiansenii]